MNGTRSSSAELEFNALLEEYRALYGLVTFRMTALDRRVPLTATAFVSGFLAMQAFPGDGATLVFPALPLILLLVMRTTVSGVSRNSTGSERATCECDTNGSATQMHCFRPLATKKMNSKLNRGSIASRACPVVVASHNVRLRQRE
jgi:hypothetical protein